MKNNKTFESYLQDIHVENHPEILDDDLPDAFDNWVAELSQETLFKFANGYAIQQYELAQEVAELKNAPKQ